MYNKSHANPGYPYTSVCSSHIEDYMTNALHVLRILRRNYIVVNVD